MIKKMIKNPEEEEEEEAQKINDYTNTHRTTSNINPTRNSRQRKHHHLPNKSIS